MGLQKRIKVISPVNIFVTSILLMICNVWLLTLTPSIFNRVPVAQTWFIGYIVLGICCEFWVYKRMKFFTESKEVPITKRDIFQLTALSIWGLFLFACAYAVAYTGPW